MNINRHNYEECFILYMDNELGSDDRRLVEEFIQKNPDLKEELNILLQHKLVPDTTILYDDKEKLMMHAGNSLIDLANYEEWLVLYLDNELSGTQRTSVDQFIAKHPSVKEEFAILMRTKLQPEIIVYANKESLYKREEKVRIIPMRWWRIAVAAILILTVGISSIVLLNKKSAPNKNEVVKSTGADQQTNKENLLIINKEEKNQVPLPEIAENVPNTIVPTSTQTKNNTAVKRINTVINKKFPGNPPLQIKKEESVLVENSNRPTNNLPQPLNNPNLNADASKNGIANANTPADIKQPGIINGNSVTNIPEQTYSNKNPDASFASLEEGGKNKKNRGFFRKAVRFFEKKTNINAADDDQLLIAGLAIKLK